MIKRILPFLLLASGLHAADVQVNYENFTGVVLGGRLIELNPVQDKRLNGIWLVPPEPVQQYTETNGITTFTNVLGGWYDLNLEASRPARYRILVPTNQNLYSAASLVTNGVPPGAPSNYVTTVTGDARYYPLLSNPSNWVTASITNGLGGSSSTVDTNGIISFTTNLAGVMDSATLASALTSIAATNVAGTNGALAAAVAGDATTLAAAISSAATFSNAITVRLTNNIVAVDPVYGDDSHSGLGVASAIKSFSLVSNRFWGNYTVTLLPGTHFATNNTAQGNASGKFHVGTNSTVNAWGATIVCTNTVFSTGAASGFFPSGDLTWNGGTLMAYFPTNIMYSLRLGNSSGSTNTWNLNGLTVKASSDGVYINGPGGVTYINGFGCTFDSQWDAMNFSPANDATNDVFRWYGCRFNAHYDDPVLNTNGSLYGAGTRGYIQAGGTSYLTGCQLSAKNGFLQAYALLVTGGTVYLSGTTLEATNTLGGASAQIYVDGSNSIVYAPVGEYTSIIQTNGGRVIYYVQNTNTVYVDGISGSDSGAGSFDAPLKTLAAAGAMVPAGGTVNALRGTFFEDFVNRLTTNVTWYLSDGVIAKGSSTTLFVVSNQFNTLPFKLDGYGVISNGFCSYYNSTNTRTFARCKAFFGSSISLLSSVSDLTPGLNQTNSMNLSCDNSFCSALTSPTTTISNSFWTITVNGRDWLAINPGSGSTTGNSNNVVSFTAPFIYPAAASFSTSQNQVSVNANYFSRINPWLTTTFALNAVSNYYTWNVGIRSTNDLNTGIAASWQGTVRLNAINGEISQTFQGPTTVMGALKTTSADVPVAVTIGSSPFSFTNTTTGKLECNFSGSVAYSISKNGASVYGSLAGDAYFSLTPNSIAVITYTVAPTMFTNSW